MTVWWLVLLLKRKDVTNQSLLHVRMYIVYSTVIAHLCPGESVGDESDVHAQVAEGGPEGGA